MISDLTDRFDLPDQPQVVAHIERYESLPVPCSVKETWTGHDRVPELLGLQDYFASMPPAKRSSIAFVEVLALRPGGREERIPFRLRR